MFEYSNSPTIYINQGHWGYLLHIIPTKLPPPFGQTCCRISRTTGHNSTECLKAIFDAGYIRVHQGPLMESDVAFQPHKNQRRLPYRFPDVLPGNPKNSARFRSSIRQSFYQIIFSQQIQGDVDLLNRQIALIYVALLEAMKIVAKRSHRKPRRDLIAAGRLATDIKAEKQIE